METQFKGMRHYDEEQLKWGLEVCTFDWAVDYVEDMEEVWQLYQSAQRAVSAYINELVELRAYMRSKMVKRVGDEDIVSLYG